MDRLACADVPQLALQLLLASHPEWKSLPAAVVDADEPSGTLLAVNTLAWRARLRPGMRYASALALDARLRAATVPRDAIETATAELTAALRGFTPHVEPSREEPGVFWLDASGMQGLYASTEAWAKSTWRALSAKGFEACLVAGFTRFGTYALARALHGSAPPGARRGPRRVLVCASAGEERRLAGDVALERLGIDPVLRDRLARLGVRTVGGFAALPAEGIRRRFGEDAATLHRRARGEGWDPLVPVAETGPLTRSVLLDDPVFDATIVLFIVRRLLAGLLAPLAGREQAVRAVAVTLQRSLRRDRPPVALRVAAAEPTLDEAVLADLVRLRLEAGVRRELAGASVVEIEVEIEAAPAAREQLRLFRERTRRDLAAGARAIARLRAELGDAAVVRAVLRDGHLPEASYAWEPVERLAAPSPRAVRLRPLVRRVYDRAVALPPSPFRERDDSWIAPVVGDAGPPVTRNARAANAGRGAGDRRTAGGRHHEADAPACDGPAGWSAARAPAWDGPAWDSSAWNSSSRDASSSNAPAPAVSPRAGSPGRAADSRAGSPSRRAHGRVEHMTGPYIVSGGWWNREVHREYHYARTEDGEILWVYYDRKRRRWFLAGSVE